LRRLWVADITYLRTWEGWLYLAAVQDVYSRRIVGWAMDSHMRTELVADALHIAIARRRPAPGLIHHSDQGSQGGFTRSSQHLDVRSCDGQAGWVDDGVDGSLGDEVAGQAVASA
jgi:transposase InsO family protein